MSADKILLVLPNMRWYQGDESTFWHIVPYNLCLIAAMIEDICDVEILDAYIDDLTTEQFTERLARTRPDVIGITIMMDQFAEAGHAAARAAKQACPEAKVVMGGVHVTVDPTAVMGDTNVDYAVQGEGEHVFRSLIRCLQGKEDFPARGVYRRENGKVISAPRADFLTDLDALKRPAYHLIDYPKYATHAPRKSVDCPRALPYARIMTSRGCPQKCVFCQVAHISGRKYRVRSPKTVLDEIAWLRDEYGIRSLIIDDDNLFTNRRRAASFFRELIERGLAMPWVAISTAVFGLDDELVELMRESGCDYMCIAIESGCERVLEDVVCKPIDYDHAKRMVAKARAAGIYVAANFIVGFPTETWDEIRQTVRFAEELCADYVKLFHAIPLRHTRLWDLCEKTGSFRSDFTVEKIRWSTGQIATNQFTPNDLTILRAYEWDRINFDTAEKRARTAAMMGISECQLWSIRRTTLHNAQTNLIRGNGVLD